MGYGRHASTGPTLAYMPRLGALAILFALAGLTACGGDADQEAEEAVSEAIEEAFSAPPCEDFEGELIPDDFEGCASSEDVIEAAFSYDCDDGRTLVAAGPVMGFEGEQAVYVEGEQAGDSPGFQPLYDECRPS